MPTIADFIEKFGWAEFWIIIVISLSIVSIREWHHFFKKGGE